jgi:outer membrane lipoprotein-sorting protein
MLYPSRAIAIALSLSAALAVLLAISTTAQKADSANATESPSLTADEIVSRMVQRNRERADALRKFQGTRVYRMQYRGFLGSRDAEMTVKMKYTSPDSKVFTVVSEQGSKFVIDHVFKAMLDAEQEAGNAENQRRTALTSDNYKFTSARLEDTPGALQYVLNVIPKTDNKYLYRGKIWIDANDFAVTRIEAEPAKSPSFWVKKSEIRHRYEKVGDFWLPLENRTESSIRLGGRALLSIDYKDYEITETALTRNFQSLGAGPGTGVPQSGASKRSDDLSNAAKAVGGLDGVGGLRQ